MSATEDDIEVIQAKKRCRLKVKDSQSGEVCVYEEDESLSLIHMFEEFSERRELLAIAEKDMLRILWDGQRISVNDTPNMLGMENDDQIDIVYEQEGGTNIEESDDPSLSPVPVEREDCLVPTENEESITLKVRDQIGEEMFFKVKKGTALSKIFHAYAQRRGVEVDTLRFLLDDTRLRGSDTPKMMEMEDFDQIDVYLEQLGGFFCCICQRDKVFKL